MKKKKEVILKEVKFLVAFEDHKKGAVVKTSEKYADYLIKHKFAESTEKPIIKK